MAENKSGLIARRHQFSFPSDQPRDMTKTRTEIKLVYKEPQVLECRVFLKKGSP